MERLRDSIIIYLGKKGGLNELTLEIFYKNFSNNQFVISSYNEEKLKYNNAFLINTFKDIKGFLFSTIFNLYFILRNFRKEILSKSTKKRIIFTGFHPWDIFFINLCKKKFEICYIIHDPETHKGESNVIINFLQGRIMKNPYVNIIALSDYSAKILEKKTSKRVEVWKLNDFFSKESQLHEIDKNLLVNLFFFGRIIEYKGFEKIPEIRNFLNKNSNLSFKFIVRGDGDKKIVNYLTSNAQSSDYDLQFGWVSNEDVRTIMKQNTIVVLPYDEATQSGIIPLAKSYGSKIVATPVGALVEQLEGYKNSRISKGITAIDIAEEIIKLIG